MRTRCLLPLRTRAGVLSLNQNQISTLARTTRLSRFTHPVLEAVTGPCSLSWAFRADEHHWCLDVDLYIPIIAEQG